MSSWARRHLDAYLEGDLRTGERERLEGQLAESAELRAELAGLRRLREVLQTLPEEDPPPLLADRVLARIAAGEANSSWLVAWQEGARRILGSAWSAPVAAAVAGVLIFALVQNVEVQITLPFAVRGAAPAALPATSPRGVSHRAFPREEPGFAREEPGFAAASHQAAPPRLGEGHVFLEVRELPPGSPRVARSQAPSPREGSLPPAENEAAALQRRFACGGEDARSPACERWRSWMLGLGLRDPPAFARELGKVPRPWRDRSLLDLSRLAGVTGSSRDLAEHLRGSDDPAANSLAPHFEGPITPVSAER